MNDPVLRLTRQAFKTTCEAEKIQAAAGRDAAYWALIEAHSALLRAKDALEAAERRRDRESSS